MWRLPTALFVATSLMSFPVAAQDTPPQPARAESERPSCVTHPSPECRYFGVTEVGVAFGRRAKRTFYFDTPETRAELFISGGVMRNLDSHDAVGVTWFLESADEAVSTGPGLQYRRWLPKRQSIDIGVGAPIAGTDYELGTIFGVVRYSPVQWLGLTVRPERIERVTFECVPQGCGDLTDTHLRMRFGADLTGRPGATALAVYGVALGVMITILAVVFTVG